MIKQGFPRLFWSMVLVTLLAGCGVVANPPTPTPLPSPTLPPPTSTPIPPTETPVPTNTPTLTPIPTQSLSSMIDALKVVSQGSGVAEAAAYDPGKSGIHPVVFVSPLDEVENLNSSLPDSWRASFVNQTELVVVVSYRYVKLNATRYKISGQSGWIFVTRIRIDTVVTLYEAQTGETVAYTVIAGGEPPSFPPSLPPGVDSLYGETVPYEKVQEWMKPHVVK
jgi:hypothetical protein